MPGYGRSTVGGVRRPAPNGDPHRTRGAEQYWFKPAKKIVEPSHDDILRASRLFLALKNLMIAHRAQAITSPLCMRTPCKACLAFSKLNDLGLVGACEWDVDSTLTMLLFGYASASRASSPTRYSTFPKTR